MPRYLGILILLTITKIAGAQSHGPLSVEKIMRDPKWIGSSPSNPFWSQDGNTLYFLWNPDSAPSDSIYYITRDKKVPVKATPAQKQFLLTTNNVSYNLSRTAYVYTKDGDVFYTDIKSGKTKRVTETTDAESNVQFSFGDTRIVFMRNQNLYAWNINGGETVQLTNLKSGEASSGTQKTGTGQGSGKTSGTNQEEWLRNDQLQYFQVLKERKEKKDKAEAYTKSLPKTPELRTINTEDKSVQGLTLSPDGRFISFRLFKASTAGKSTIVPSYVTETGFTTDLPARTKVGAPLGVSEYFVYDRQKDTIYTIRADSVPGIKDIPEFVKDYPKEYEKRTKNPANRAVSFSGPVWSPDGKNAVVEIRSLDNKDRWLMILDTSSGKLKLLDRQHDEAWIGGPGTNLGFGGSNAGWLDENTFWFQSEVTGYSHLYTINVLTGERRALTSGNYEVQQSTLSKDKKYFYIITNEIHPGEQHFYRLNITDGKKEQLSSMKGANQVVVSPDEKWLAVLHSYATTPWELYLQENKPGSKPEQVTNRAQSGEFKSYAWKDPEVISFTARDGARVYARVYKPSLPDPKKPAVIFVHGAGYLQNAHKWWSSYFREYMFNNLLADNGYYVMDIDYRASAGYGRNWRTGIYRHMGGKDLEDNVDAADFLVKNYGVDPRRIGIYGGSYGGFITLMGLFTTPDVFAAGAALRPVTDWANYNHGYTSNILNEPFTDSIAYRRSSPFYFAEGLKNHLLICHGMIDVNVHFQDAVKLSQRLIELGKDNWEIAPYPMEDHGFVEPSSWTDEYKRIFKLFETVLKK
jgi:dipeptidyl aminopeptidase/acylaminoacyl peptidase